MKLSGGTKKALIAAAVAAPFLIVAAGSALPQTHEIFYTNFVWKYFWGPSVADIEGRGVQYHGVWAADEYTLVSEMAYGAILILCLIGIYRILNRAHIWLDEKFIYALVPFVFLGPILRVFEDAWLFKPPMQYLFIAPFLFFLMGGMVLLFLLIGARIRDLHLPPFRQALYFGAVMGIICALYGIAYIGASWQFAYMVPPAHVALYGAASVCVFALFCYRGAGGPATAALSFGAFTLLVSAHVLAEWTNSPWSATMAAPQPMVIAVVIGFALGVSLLVFAAAKLLSVKFPKAAHFATPVNIMMVFGHQVDAWASTIAINPDFQRPFGLQLASYCEKHPLPDLFLGLGGGYAYILVKLALILLMIYLIDIASEEDMRKYPALKILIKLTIIALGMGPGIRDFLRAAMSV